MNLLAEFKDVDIPPEVTVIGLTTCMPSDVDESDLIDLWRDGFLQLRQNQNVLAVIAENDGFVGLTEGQLSDFLDELGHERCFYCACADGCDC